MSKKRKHVNRKKRRSEKRSLKNWELCGRTNKHHDIAKSRGGGGNNNLYIWDIISHRAWHAMFGNRSLLEVARWLTYIYNEKQDGINHELRMRGEDNAM